MHGPEAGEFKEQQGGQWPDTVREGAVGREGGDECGQITSSLVCMVGVQDFR